MPDITLRGYDARFSLVVASGTFGAAPTTPAYQRINFNTISVTDDVSQNNSEQISLDGGVSAVYNGTETSSLTLTKYLRCNEALTELLEPLLDNEFAARGTASAKVTEGTYNIGDTVISTEVAVGSGDFAVGQGVQFGTDKNIYIVSAVGTDEITLETGLLADIGDAVAITECQVLTMGESSSKVLHELSAELNHTDVATDDFYLYHGVEIGSYTLESDSGNNAPITESFTMMGHFPVIQDTAIAGATYTAANTGEPATPCNTKIYIDDVDVTDDITTRSLTIERNLSDRIPHGQCNSRLRHRGEFAVNGSFTMYSSDGSYIEKLQTGTEIKIKMVDTDSETGGNQRVIRIGTAKITAANRDDIGGTAERLLNLEFSALENALGRIEIFKNT